MKGIKDKAMFMLKIVIAACMVCGIVKKGKSENFVPRTMFTTESLATWLYPEMYGQYYVLTLEDGQRVLLLVGCKDVKAVEAGDYQDMMAAYYEFIPYVHIDKYDNETSHAIVDLEQEMDISGCIWMADTEWADRHDFGIFMVKFGKFLLLTTIMSWLIIEKDELDEKEMMKKEKN